MSQQKTKIESAGKDVDWPVSAFPEMRLTLRCWMKAARGCLASAPGLRESVSRLPLTGCRRRSLNARYHRNPRHGQSLGPLDLPRLLRK